MSHSIKLTCCMDSDNPLNISALEIAAGHQGNATAGRECIIDSSEATAFRDDCTGWDNDRYNEDFGIVVYISSDDWERWCAGYEVVADAAYADALETVGSAFGGW